MKKLTALILVMLLALSACPLCIAEGEYAETLKISIGTAETLADDSYVDNFFFKHIEEKFNVDVEVFTAAADFDTLTNVWIATGDMPDLMTYGGDLEALMDYGDQGLLAALPEGWETAYPNLYVDFAATEMQPYVTSEDGRVYVIPRVVMSPNFPTSFGTPTLLTHMSMMYRKDWAEELGFTEIENMTTFEELKAYMKAAMDANLDGTSVVYGITGTSGQMINQMVITSEPYFDSFYIKDGQYILGASTEATVTGIKRMKELYDEGYLDPDFYTYTNESRNMWYVGNAAILADNGHVGGPQTFGKNIIENNANVEDETDFGMTNLLAEDGQYRAKWADSFFRTLVFNPALEGDAEKYARILSILDYLSTAEGATTLHYGEQGVNWEYAEDGSVTILEAYPYGPGAPKIWYNLSPSSQDAMGYCSLFPVDVPWAVEMSANQRLAKAEYMADDMITYAETIPVSRWNTEAATLFKSIDWKAEIVRIVMAGDVDVASEWNSFIESNRALWEPMLNELNASL